MKGMLTRNDLKQIGEVMDDKLVEVLEAVNKGFSGVQEQFQGMTGEVAGLKGDVAGLKKEMVAVKATMVTKDYLDEKLGKVNGKINVLVDVLHKNNALTSDQRGIVQAA